MRVETLCLVVLAVLATATGTAVATDNTPPLAAAGVDQTVSPGTTVYLDANGSTDPDGTITSVDWAIETPGGTAQSPACGTCRQTHFEAATVGQYTVTLSVTDDDGATRSDTLYVTVEDEDGPSVSLSGPTTATRGSSTTLTANADEADASLESISWVVDGDVVEQQSLSGSDVTTTLTRSFATADNVSVSAVVYDTLGYRGSASRTVTVVGGGGSSGGSDDGSCNPSYQFCSDSDGILRIGGETQLINSNGEAGIQMYENGELVEIDNPATSQYISQDENEAYVLDDGATVNEAIDDTDTAEEIEQSFDNKASDSNSNGGSNGGSNDDGSSGSDGSVGDPFSSQDDDSGSNDNSGGDPFGGSSTGGGDGGDKGGDGKGSWDR